jgi:hypothetical protein
MHCAPPRSLDLFNKVFRPSRQRNRQRHFFPSHFKNSGSDCIWST